MAQSTFALPGPPASASLHGSTSFPDRPSLPLAGGQEPANPSHHPDDPKGIITNVQGIVPTLQ